MPAPSSLERLRSRHVLSLALCAGVIALGGCPKMPRISTLDAMPSPDSSATATPLASPSPDGSPETSPNPDLIPTIRSLVVGDQPQGIAVDALGNGYVTLANDIVSISGATGDLKGTDVISLSTSKDTSFSFGSPMGIVKAGQGNVVWFADKARRQLRQISEGATETTQDFSFGLAPTRVAYDAQHKVVWVLDSGDHALAALSALALSGEAPVPADLKGVPNDLAVDDGGRAWTLVTAKPAVHVTRLSPVLSGNQVAGLQVDVETLLGSLEEGKGIAIGEDQSIWVTGLSANGRGQLMKLDRENGTPTGNPTGDFNLDFTPGRFAIRGGFAWIAGSNESGYHVFKVSLSTGAVAATYPLPGPAAEVFKDDSGDFWLPISTGQSVVKLDF